MNTPEVQYSTIHRAEIEIPEEFFRTHGHTPEYEKKSVQIAESAGVVSGQDAYGRVFEWAEDSSEAALKEWADAWLTYLGDT